MWKISSRSLQKQRNDKSSVLRTNPIELHEMVKIKSVSETLSIGRCLLSTKNMGNFVKMLRNVLYSMLTPCKYSPGTRTCRPSSPSRRRCPFPACCVSPTLACSHSCKQYFKVFSRGGKYFVTVKQHQLGLSCI